MNERQVSGYFGDNSNDRDGREADISSCAEPTAAYRTRGPKTGLSGSSNTSDTQLNTIIDEACPLRALSIARRAYTDAQLALFEKRIAFVGSHRATFVDWYSL